jgi:hypothetical protein
MSMKSNLTARTLIAVTIAVLAIATVGTQQSSSRTPVPKETLDRWMKELSNWGRWGKDDQLGSLNLVTPEKKRQAMALAKTGTVVSLERKVTLQEKDAEIKADGKPSGVAYYEMRFRTFPKGDKRGNDGFSSDIQEFAVHGSLMTHIDSLCHDSDAGQLYNGYPLDSVNQQTGCTKNSLDNLKEGIVTRGVLVDMSRLKSATPRDPALTRVYPDDIDAWEKQTGLKVSAGDALFVYNPAPPGAPGAAAAAGTPPGGGRGIDNSILPWLKARGVAVTSGTDHRVSIVALGIYLIDSVDLTRLAETAARLNRWEFLFVVAPVPAPGSTGFPVNPLALF